MRKYLPHILNISFLFLMPHITQAAKDLRTIEPVLILDKPSVTTHKQSKVYTDGSKYVGNLVDGLRHGQGTLLFDGSKYVGEWKDGKKHGQGAFTWVDGSRYVGEFEKGNAVGGWKYWTSGKRKWAYENSNGKWIYRRKKPR